MNVMSDLNDFKSYLKLRNILVNIISVYYHFNRINLLLTKCRHGIRPDILLIYLLVDWNLISKYWITININTTDFFILKYTTYALIFLDCVINFNTTYGSGGLYYYHTLSSWLVG